jgi:phage shock protein C
MNHFRSKRLRGLYRSRNGIVLGVCRGLGNFFDFKVIWIRIIFVVLLLITGIWPMLGIYLLAALIMKPDPFRRMGHY